MDVFFYYKSVTDIPLYNCSALTEVELDKSTALRNSLRGFIIFTVGFPMLLIYIACLRVMVKQDMIKKSCYKIMFVLGLYDITSVLINDVFMAYVFSSGMKFCDAPNTLYIVGCLHVACWAGVSYFCLYLALNRIIDALNLRHQLVDFFFSKMGTTIGTLIGITYSSTHLFLSTPAVYTRSAETVLPTPLAFETLPVFEYRYGLLIANNCGVVILNCIVYGIFCLILHKKQQKLSFSFGLNRLHRQVFLQSFLLCIFNFFIALAYSIFLFVDGYIILVQLCYLVYQFTAGLQALIYLLFNHAILNGVRNDLVGFLAQKPRAIKDSKQTRPIGPVSTQLDLNVLSVPSIR